MKNTNKKKEQKIPRIPLICFAYREKGKLKLTEKMTLPYAEDYLKRKKPSESALAFNLYFTSENIPRVRTGITEWREEGLPDTLAAGNLERELVIYLRFHLSLCHLEDLERTSRKTLEEGKTTKTEQYRAEIAYYAALRDYIRESRHCLNNEPPGTLLQMAPEKHEFIRNWMRQYGGRLQ